MYTTKLGIPRVFTILLLFSFSLVQGQTDFYKIMMNDNSYNFYEVIDSAEAYFTTIDISKKGSGWKPYQRWKNANEPRFYPDGNRSNISFDFVNKQFAKFNKSTPTKNLFPGGWRDLGPYSVDSITGHYAAGIGRVEDIYVDGNNPNIIYQGSRSGGFWRTSNGGASWQGGSTDFLPGSGVNTITASPTNPDSILINVRNAQNGNSYGLYRSVDGGITFQESNFNPTNVGFGGQTSGFKIFYVTYHPRIPDLIFIGTDKGIYRSDDNLQTWSRMINTADITEIDFHPTNDDIIYLYDSYFYTSTPDQIYISTDRGDSYYLSSIISGNGGNRTVQLDVSPVCPDCIYFASSNGIWKSTDLGVNFTFLSNPPESCHGFAVSDQDTSIMIYGYVDLYRSIDGGQSFNQCTWWSLGNTNGAGNGHQTSYDTSTDYIHADTRQLFYKDGIIYVGTDGFLSKSINDGVGWENIGEGVGIRENYCLGVSQSDQTVTMCGSQDNGTSISTDNLWVEFYGADGMEAIVHPLNPDYMIGSLQYGGRRKTTDKGQSQTGANPSGSSNAYWIAPLDYDPLNPMTIYDFRDKVYRSDDFGETHVSLGSPVSFTGNINKAAIAYNNSDIIVISKDRFLEKSTDGGLTFSSIATGLPNQFIEDIAFDPNDDNTIIVVYAKFGLDNMKVYKTTNGGSSWTNITHNLGSMPIRSVVIDHTNDSNIYLGAEVGVYTMPMNASSWNLYAPALPNVSVRELEVVRATNTLRAATWGRGLWEYSLVDRLNYPAIVQTEISNPPTHVTPKESIDQFVTSKIHYESQITSAFINWSQDPTNLNNTISMTNVSDSTWVSDEPLGDFPVGEKVYFQVFAVGKNQDTTETYRFMYEYKEFKYCDASGHTDAGNLFISNVTVANIDNDSANDGYTLYDSPLLILNPDSTYTIEVSNNTGWEDNDLAVWIDFNKDAEFDIEEQILLSLGTGSFGTANFTVPVDAVVNDTLRMRVRLSYWGADPLPCDLQFGELEDYLVVIEGPQTCGMVTKTNDAGAETLRDLVACKMSGDTIRFSDILTNNTITLSTSPIVIDKDLTIINDYNVTISSVIPQIASLPNVFQVSLGISLTLENVIIEGAYGLEGSAILNEGTLILKDCEIYNGGKTNIISTVKNIGTGTLEILGSTHID